MTALAWSPDARLLAVGAQDGGILVWDVEEGAPRYHLSAFTTEVTGLLFHPQGHWLIGGGRGEPFAYIWEAVTGQQVLTISQMTPQAVSRDGRTLAGGSPLTVGWCDLLSPEVVRPLSQHRASVERVSWSPDNRRVVSVDAGFGVCVWDRTQWSALDCFRDPDTQGNFHATNAAAAVSAGGRWVAYASGGRQARAFLRDTRERKTLGPWPLPQGYERMVCPEQDRFLLVREQVARQPGVAALESVAWELRPGRVPEQKQVVRPAERGDREGFYTSGVTPDGRYFWWVGPRAPAQNERLEVREVATGKLHFRLATDSGEGAVLLSPDGKQVWSNGVKNTPQRYELNAPTEPTRVEQAPLAVVPGRWLVLPQASDPSVVPALRLRRWNGAQDWLLLRTDGWSSPRFPTFSPDGRYLAWGSASGVLTVADVEALEGEVGKFEKAITPIPNPKLRSTETGLRDQGRNGYALGRPDGQAAGYPMQAYHAGMGLSLHCRWPDPGLGERGPHDHVVRRLHGPIGPLPRRVDRANTPARCNAGPRRAGSTPTGLDVSDGPAW
ncbi:MAG: hypothetical protein L0Z62_22025 [Gemmataceae bacterium]|nr:hypothetical protein [Gemmataceae bacterium]